MDPTPGSQTLLAAPRLRPVLALVLSLAALHTLAPVARAASVSNGDFETGDLSGWATETDGESGGAPDFSVVSTGSGYAARIQADYYASSGDVTSSAEGEVFIANTLHQELDLSAEPGEELTLRFDWSFDGEDGSGTSSEVFLVALTDGSGQVFGAQGMPGYLLAPRRSYGGGSFETSLAPSVFNNASGWSLEVQLLVGVDPASKQHNALGSYVEIDDVSFVPEPGLLAGLVSGLLLLSVLRPRRRERQARSRTPALALAVLLTATPTLARAWTDVSGSAALSPHAQGLDRVSGRLFSYAQVTNQSTTAYDDLRLVIEQSSMPVHEPDGWTDAGEPYMNLAALGAGKAALVRVDFPLARAHLDYSLRLEALLPPAEPLSITTAASLSMDPNGVTPLAGLISASTNVPARATLTATSASDSFMVEFHDYTTEHALPLLGLHADSSYTVSLSFTDANGVSVADGPLVAMTPSLPTDGPDIDVLVNVPASKEPGYTWIDPVGGYVFIFDQEAEIVWYSTSGGGDTKRVPNGNRLWAAGTDQVRERDLLGNVVRNLTMQIGALPEADLHHELFPTVHKTFLSLDKEHVFVDDYPTSTTDPNAPTATKELRDEPLVEFLEDGTQIKRWPLVDILDPRRIASESASSEPIDWAHTNAIIHDPRDDSLIVSVRHQDCIIKVDRVTGALKWILGTPSNWTPEFEALRLQPVGPLTWQYHQHAMMITPDGNLLLFDNGNFRRSPFDPFPVTPNDENYSRAVEFAIDEQNLELTQVWEWSPPHEDRIYSWFLSDADALPQTGNVLIDFGGVSHIGGVATSDLGYGSGVARLIEVTRDTPGQVVMDIQLSHPTERISAYRAERWDALYPPNATRTEL